MKTGKLNNLLKQLIDFYKKLKNYDLYVYRKKKEDIDIMRKSPFMTKEVDEEVKELFEEESVDMDEDIESAENTVDMDLIEPEEEPAGRNHYNTERTPIQTPTDHLKDLTKGMTRDELEIISDEMPIELCFNRIGKEIQKTKTLVKSLKEAIDIYERS